MSEHDGIIVRKARKPWVCQAAEHHVDCPGAIRAGEHHVEYVGEAHAYSSGTRYALACARVAFGEDAIYAATPQCDHGLPPWGLCADCRERRTGVPDRD